jgi:Recombination endonuclease VII
MDRKFCKRHNNGEGAWIDTSAFTKSTTSRDGFYTYCKDCAKKALYEWRAKNADKLKAINYKWREQNREILREGHAIAKAKWRRKDPAKKAADGWKSHLKGAHGLTPEWYDQRFKDQNGLCAICGNPPQKFRLRVDHDHKTEVRRGLLCNSCNVALERVETIPDWHAKALAYLAQYEPPKRLCEKCGGELDPGEQQHMVEYLEYQDGSDGQWKINSCWQQIEGGKWRPVVQPQRG